MALSLDFDSLSDPSPERAPQPKPLPEPAKADAISSELDKRLALTDDQTKAIKPGIAKVTDAIMTTDTLDIKSRDDVMAQIDALGTAPADAQASRHANSLVDTQLRELGAGTSNQDAVGNQLLELSETLKDIDPHLIDFSDRGILGLRRIRRWIRRYEGAGTTIDGIVKSLDKGAYQLRCDAKTLEQESVKAQRRIVKLEEDSAVAQQLTESLTAEIARRREAATSQAELQRIDWVEKDVLFRLAHRSQTLAAVLATEQQSVVSMEMIRHNAESLAMAVDDTKATSIPLMRTAVMISAALQKQKDVEKALDAVYDVNNRLIQQNAQQLKETSERAQAIQKRAPVAAEALEQSYDLLRQTVDSANAFRQEAIPEMRAQADRFHALYEQTKGITDALAQGDLS